ncbi:PAS domain-containing hybrid sensor histidine kinase/response regulator [Endozoicomonas ascidiicola]|uniref:PAS domain-containing hybrid sensor histidine kinase/response regulator n=1 Tax=Endozoicomonas ascidiicola TaxID=1698521 RepID=UPI00082CB84D|nr:PAS domain-containing hybrid sensor histidine kinase/response regulator [Endozoicomonas ascidiicola]
MSGKSISIRKKIALFNLLPALVFYIILSFVFLFFAFRYVSSEIAINHINETLRYSAIVDSNLRFVVNLGWALSSVSSISDLENFGLNDFLNNDESISHVVSVSLVEFIENQAGYDRRDRVLWHSEHSQISENVLFEAYPHVDDTYFIDNDSLRKNGQYWYVHGVIKDPDLFITSYIIRSIRQNGRLGFVRIDIDGRKLLGDAVNLSHDSRAVIANQHGDIVFANGISLPRMRSIHEFAKKGPCTGYSELFFPDIGNNSVSDFILNPIVSHDDHSSPCDYFVNVLDEVVNSGRLTSVRIESRGYTRWSTAVPLGTVGWFFSFAIKESYILTPLRKQAVLSGSLISIACLCSILCLWIVSGRIVSPLNRLKEEMNAFGSVTSYNNQYGFEVNDEIDSLHRSFHQLKNRLLSREGEIQRLRFTNFGSLVNQLKGGYFYFSLSKSGKIKYVSPSIKSVLGFSEEQFVGLFQDYLTDALSNYLFKSMLQETFADTRPESFELEMMHRDGTSRFIEVYCGWLEHKGDLSSCGPTSELTIEGLGNDVTNRVKDAERFRLLVAGSPDAIVITDNKGIIQLINRQVVNLFRYDDEDIVGLPLSILIDPESRDQLVLLDRLEVNSPETHCLNEVLSRGYNRHGFSFPVEISSNVLMTLDGAIISIVFRDITEREAIQNELLRAKETAEKASSAKSLFLSHISHELRTPLNGVLGYAQLLLTDSEIHDHCRESLGCLESCGLHLLTMINDILDITKIESGAVKADPVPFNLMHTIEVVLANVRELAFAKALELKVTVNEYVPDEIVADHIKLRQVLINLVGNAVKFSSKGSICLNLSIVTGKLLFEVIDRGPGIALEEVNRLFQPFTQLNQGSDSGGVGLGLSICYRLVKAMGGELQVDSVLGEGSNFYFSIPCQTCEGKEVSALSLNIDHSVGITSHSISATKGKILVVDDSQTNRNMLVKALESRSYSVDAAADGVKALELFHANRYEVILMDLRMPVMDGFEAARSILAVSGQKTVNIIAVSASVTDSTQMKITEYGFASFISKPIRFDQLFEILEHYMGSDQTNELSMQVERVVISEMTAAMKRSLDIGDIDSLHRIASTWVGNRGYGDYPNKIVAACKSLDIHQLETLCDELKSSQG